ncbi:MAG: hypothetical protein ACYDEY_04290 [Acidimicrobiales bacterium]
MRFSTRRESTRDRNPAAIAYFLQAVTSIPLHGQECAERMLRTGRHRADKGIRKSLIASAVVLLALGLSACTPGAWGPPPGTGDPGNVRLHQLRANPIFSMLPPGAVRTSIKLHPARWDNFYGGWSGMGVDEYFISTAPPAQVFSFFNAKATKLGWHPSRFNVSNPGGPFWSKRLPGGDDASMSLDISAGPDSSNYTSYPLGTNPVPLPGNTYDLTLSGNAIDTTP